MKTNPIISIQNPPSAIPATKEQLLSLGVTEEEIALGEKRFKMSCVGPWGICRSLSGIVEKADSQSEWPHEVYSKEFYPVRKVSRPISCGYHMEGKISLKGKKESVFTTSQLFELPDGKLIDVATLHICKR